MFGERIIGNIEAARDTLTIALITYAGCVDGVIGYCCNVSIALILTVARLTGGSLIPAQVALPAGIT